MSLEKFLSVYLEAQSSDFVFGRHCRRTFLTQNVSQISATTFELVEPIYKQWQRMQCHHERPTETVVAAIRNRLTTIYMNSSCCRRGVRHAHARPSHGGRSVRLIKTDDVIGENHDPVPGAAPVCPIRLDV
ncbi:hypothetical protein EVAR_51172_1 [Eumeta japonica]|uniref:Uncharacterized protein n=1 Tax=Eumeta variegata TaxID=151549 RepID=A0A4C1XD73_EUMVA|nr:hypothetical protein EVAR_51172_1 [Eumeta japonica]